MHPHSSTLHCSLVKSNYWIRYVYLIELFKNIAFHFDCFFLFLRQDVNIASCVTNIQLESSHVRYYNAQLQTETFLVLNIMFYRLHSYQQRALIHEMGGLQNTHLSLNLSVCIHIYLSINSHIRMYICECMCMCVWESELNLTFCLNQAWLKCHNILWVDSFLSNLSSTLKVKTRTMQWELTVLYYVVSCEKSSTHIAILLVHMLHLDIY